MISAQINTLELSAVVREKFKKIKKESDKQYEYDVCRLSEQVVRSILYDKPENPSKQAGHQTEKIFTPQNSLLTDMLENPHIRSFYYLFVGILSVLCWESLITSKMKSDRYDFGIDMILAAFDKFNYVALAWICMQLFVILFYGFFYVWAKSRTVMSKTLKQIWDILALNFVIGYQIVLLIFASMTVMYLRLPFVSSFVTLTEMARFMMKMHAFVRSVSPRVLNEDHAHKIPEFSWYLYFLFVPTLVYKDSYPRTNNTNWRKVFGYAIEFIADIFFMSFLASKFIVGVWSRYTPENTLFDFSELLIHFIQCIIPNFMLTLCGHYVLQHCWFNLTSEILKFADRKFYADWWTQSSYNGFYRTWNIVVHDWLHTYIHRDISKLTNSRLCGMLSVFIISAIFHEIILAFALGFFYPVMLLIFGTFGVVFMFTRKYSSQRSGNIFVLLSFAFGGSMMYCLYSLEYFARYNCPAKDNVYIDFVTPRSWYCR